MNKFSFSIWLALVSLILSLNLSVYGQGTTSRLTGTVTDNAGHGCAGVTLNIQRQGSKKLVTPANSINVNQFVTGFLRRKI